MHFTPQGFTQEQSRISELSSKLYDVRTSIEKSMAIMAGANELCLPIGITQRFFYLNDGTDIDQHVNINKVGYATYTATK